MPASAGDFDIGGPVQSVSVGDEHVCALMRSGGVRCWGAGTDGKLGYGNTTRIGDDEAPASVGEVALPPP